MRRLTQQAWAGQLAAGYLTFDEVMALRPSAVRSDDDRVRAVVEASFAEAAEAWLSPGDAAEGAG